MNLVSANIAQIVRGCKFQTSVGDGVENGVVDLWNSKIKFNFVGFHYTKNHPIYTIMVKAVKNALISVFHKEGLDELLAVLKANGTHIYSTGVGVLIGRYKRLKPRGVLMFIQSPRPTVDRVLALSGIYNIMIKAG